MNEPIEPLNFPSQPSDEYLAALDIGSNSFHFVLARQVGQHLQIVHKEKYRVQLAQGLSENQELSANAIKRGVATLSSIATSIQQLTHENFRAVATFTLRQAKNTNQFLKAAKEVFPFNIEVISGHEEARLIYQGVAHHRQYNEQQLVIDIGGGSTEFIIGKEYQVKCVDSVNIGCVSYQKAYFSTGEISSTIFNLAIQHAKHEVDNIAKRFKKVGWKHVVGTSGTIKAIVKIINQNVSVPRKITLQDLQQLKTQLLDFKHVDKIAVEGLKENRRTLICSGVAILIAIFEVLDIDQIEFCQYALREGVLFEQLANIPHNVVKHGSVRERTVYSLAERFNIDVLHATTTKDLAVKIYEMVKKSWVISNENYRTLLTFALILHEIGFDINASGYQKHGQYILTQTDLPGFNQEQQQSLAWLVGTQRKKITPLEDEDWHLFSAEALHKLAIIMRLSVLLNQQRHINNDFLLNIGCSEKSLTLTIEEQWLIERPIIDTELFYEKETIKQAFGITLTIMTA